MKKQIKTLNTILNVIDFKEKQGGYEVTLDCINAEIDIETANEFTEESGLL